jgi:hypothetical protein
MYLAVGHKERVMILQTYELNTSKIVSEHEVTSDEWEQARRLMDDWLIPSLRKMVDNRSSMAIVGKGRYKITVKVRHHRFIGGGVEKSLWVTPNFEPKDERAFDNALRLSFLIGREDSGRLAPFCVKFGRSWKLSVAYADWIRLVPFGAYLGLSNVS